MLGWIEWGRRVDGLQCQLRTRLKLGVQVEQFEYLRPFLAGAPQAVSNSTCQSPELGSSPLCLLLAACNCSMSILGLLSGSREHYAAAADAVRTGVGRVLTTPATCLEPL